MINGDIIKLAFRNIWRNRRRTLITATAVAFAVFTASTMRSFQKGVWDKVVDGSVNQYFGFIQVHGNGYWKEQTLDKAFYFDENLENTSKKQPEVIDILPRLESFALASSGDLTKGVLVIGINPEKENAMSNVAEKIIAGRYIQADDEAMIIGSGLAEKLKLSVGDTLVLISQGYHGANAAGKYPIQGIFKLNLPELNNRVVYLPLKSAQDFYGASDMLTTLAFRLTAKEKTQGVIENLEHQLDTSQYEIMSWEKTIPALVQARALDEAGGRLIFFLLYTLIGFGLFGTIMMMTKERTYEFGVLTAIGMRRNALFITIWLETLFISLLGTILGIFISMPIVYYLKTHPIDMRNIKPEAGEVYEKFGIEPVLPTTFEPDVFIHQAIIIFVLTSILALYPYFKIRNMEPVQAMRAG